MPGAVEFGISVPLAVSDAAEPGERRALEVPPAGRQGTGGWQEPGGLVGVWNRESCVCSGLPGQLICCGEAVAIPPFPFCPCWRRAALPVVRQGLRAMPSAPAALGHLGCVGACRAASGLRWSSRARGGRYFELAWLCSAWTLHSGPDSSVSHCESLVPSYVPSWVEIRVTVAFADLELILCLLDTSEPHWLENKARCHNLKS